MTENNSAASGKSTATSDRGDKKVIRDLRIWRGTVTMQQTKMKTYIETPGRVLLLPEIETRLGLLESYMTRFNEYQSKLEVEDPEEQESDKRCSYEEVYISIKSKLLSLKGEESPRASISGVSSFMNSSKPNANLPKINIKSFSGKFPDWADFYSTFRALVEKNEALSDVEKLAYLRGSLDAEPLQVISNIGLDESGFNNSISLLKARYENKRLIFQGHITTLVELKTVDKPSVCKLRSISDQVNSHLRALKSMATMEQIAEGLLLNLLGSKIDTATKLKWEEEAPLNILPTLDVFSSFLNRRCQTLENVEFGKRDPVQSSKDEVKAPCKGKPLHRSSFSANHAIPTCTVCKGQDHDIPSCGFFRKLAPLERYFEAKRLNLCLNCLKMGHAIKNCKARRCRYCSYKHHTLLHRHQTQGVIEEENTANKESTFPRNQEASSTSAMTSQIGIKDDKEESPSDPSDVVLATALVDIEGSLGTFTPYRALLDSGSSSHFVTERLVQQLRLKRLKVDVNVDGIGPVTIVVKHKVELFIQSRNNDFCTTIEALVLPKIANQQPSRVVDIKAWKIPQNITLADPVFHTPQPIDILIGAGLFFELMSVGQVRLGKGLPVLQKTLFGWIVCGGGKLKTTRCMVAVRNFQDDEPAVIDIVRKFWEIEEVISLPKALNVEEEECEKHFVEYVKRDDSGRFCVRLPFRKNSAILGNSLEIAKKRFFSLEQKLTRNPELQKQYAEFMSEYVNLGHMERVSSLSSLDNYYILPHHCVLKPDSSTTKLRVVFDASCKTTSGISLNDTLMVGPVIQDDLFDILLRFRARRYAITADISKMYRRYELAVHSVENQP